MPRKSQFVASSALFDIDENEDFVSTKPHANTHNNARPEPVMIKSHESIKRVSIQAAATVHDDESGFEISQDDPVLGDEMSFHRQSSTTHTRRRKHSTPSRERARSRRLSVAPWPIFGLVLPMLVLRTITSLVVMPLVVAGLVFIPQVAVVWLCVLLVCCCCYEYSWIAFRIHYQLLSTYSWYERAPSEEETYAEEEEDAEHFHFQSFISGSVNHSIISDSLSSFSQDGFAPEAMDGDDVDHTVGGENGMAARAAKTVASPLDTLEFAGVITAVSSFADSWCGGREWIATLLLAAVVTPLWVLAMHYLGQATFLPVALRDFPSVVVFGIHELTWIANAFACLMAFSTPNMRFAVSMLIQVNVFFAILVNSLVCPVLSIHKCSQPLLSATELFALGAIFIFALRGLTSSSPADMVIVTMVDFLGYLFVVGGLSLLVGAVDLHHDPDHMYARVLLLLVTVLWAAQIAGYACDRLMSHLQLSRYRLLPRRIAVRIDLESTVSAVCVGVLATALGGSLLSLPTSMPINVVFAFFSVLLARLGALFMGLLRRAAGLRRCSRALPGLGGVLDMTSALLFAAVVFAKLYVVVMLRLEETAAARESAAVHTDALSIGFSGLD